MEQMYNDLNDAMYVNDLLKSGEGAQIWYMKPGVSRDWGMGYTWLAQEGMIPNSPADLSETHVKLGQIRDTKPNLENLFRVMQGENWSPNGEARDLIKSLGLRHTSMSVGDVVIMENEMYIVDTFGFRKMNPEDNDKDLEK